MSRPGPAARTAWVLVSLASLLGCSKRSSEPAELSGLRVLPAAPPTPSDDPAAAIARHDPFDYDGSPLTYTATTTVDASFTPPVDPDLAVVEAARAAASGCFDGNAEGPDERSATISVTVVPTGSVSRAEVSSEPDVRDCLARVGGGLHFTDRPPGAPVRTFSIDVHVRRAH